MFIVTFVSNFIYIVYNPSSRKEAESTENNLFVYETPDSTIWINKDKEALERMRLHYIEESDGLFTRMDAEKQQVKSFKALEPEVKERLITSYNLKKKTQGKEEIRNNQTANFLIFNSITIVTGFLLFYFITFLRSSALRSSASKSHKPLEATQKQTKETIDSQIAQESETAGEETGFKPIYEKNIGNNAPSNKGQILDKAKDIICEILQIINKYSENSIVTKSDEFENFTIEQIQNIQDSLTLNEFLAIEDRISKELPSQFEKARNLIKVKFDELRAMLNDLAEDFGSVAKDNTNFSEEIKNSMSHIEKAIELDEIKEIRKRIAHETGELRKTITSKQEKDTEMIKTLSYKVKIMNEELVLIKEETLIDSLTQVYNRKAFDKKLDDAFKNNSEPNKPFTLIMADLDYFKKINDDFGHIVGDEVLKKIAITIKGTFRLNDFVARYGGEEFVVIIDRIDKQYVLEMCERARFDIENMNFKIKDETIPISISIGAAFCKTSDTQQTLLDRADKALYLAKQSGRNIIKTEEQLPESQLK